MGTGSGDVGRRMEGKGSQAGALAAPEGGMAVVVNKRIHPPSNEGCPGSGK